MDDINLRNPAAAIDLAVTQKADATLFQEYQQRQRPGALWGRRAL